MKNITLTPRDYFNILCITITLVFLFFFLLVPANQRVRLQGHQFEFNELNTRLDKIEKAMAERLGMTDEEFQEWLNEHSQGTDDPEKGH